MLVIGDLDHLGARLHGRRSRMAEGARLYELCGLGSAAGLASALFPGAGLASAGPLQRRLEEELFLELKDLALSIGGAGGALLDWMAARLRVEDIKIAVRRVFSGAPRDEALRQLAAPPHDRAALAEARTAEELLAALPAGPLRDALAAGYALYQGKDGLFFLEASLDRSYLGELLRRASALPSPGREAAFGLAAQEADLFHLSLVVRGRFFYGFDKKDLLPLHVPGSKIDLRRFSRMLSAGSPEDARVLAAGLAVDGQGPEDLERAGRLRYARLARRAFRGSGADPGLAAGYAALRRLEAAALTTVAEGLRLGVPAAELRALLPGREEKDV